MIESIDVTHKDIYDKINLIENDVIVLGMEVKQLQESTKDLIEAFNAAKGAFQVMEWIARMAKPLMVIAGLLSTAYYFIRGIKG